MGSVKRLIPSWPGYIKPEANKLGLGVWEVSGGFSVGDLKSLIPKQQIAHKPAVLAMTTAAYWETAATDGFISSYIGMLDPDDEIVDVGTLLDRGQTSNRVVMRLAKTPLDYCPKLTAKSRAWYHRLIERGSLTAYVADAECIFRLGIPLGSSWLKKLAIAAGFGDRYELVATYDDTAALLDEVRAAVDADSKGAVAVRQMTMQAGLRFVPNPGQMLDFPLMNFDTKFNPAGDQTMSIEEAQWRMHLGDLEFAAWQTILERNALHQRDFCLERGIHDFDGKTECLVVGGVPIFADFAVTVDENRLTIRYVLADGTVIYVPANKEIQRAIFRQYGIYAAKDAAIRDHGDTWLDCFLQYVPERRIEEATVESVRMMEQVICTVGNMLLGTDIFPAEPIADWIEPFIPYSSREQSAIPPTGQLTLL